MHTIFPSHSRTASGRPCRRRAARACLPGFLAFLAAAAFAPGAAAQQRTDDNRRLAWTGSYGADWSGSSWKTADSYLSRLNTTEAQWTGPIQGSGEPSLAFLAGDSVLFDSTGNAAARAIAIADGGVTASDVVVSGAGDYTFTGGVLTADGGVLTPTTYQLAGPGVAPGGRLVKTGSGSLTLSNAGNVFKGGILLAEGWLRVTNKNALGGNTITILPLAASGTGYILPAIVADANGTLLRASTATSLTDPGIHVASGASGLDITGAINFATTTGGLRIQTDGDATISGRIAAAVNTIPAGPTGGVLFKHGDGTLTLTGSNNAFINTGSTMADVNNTGTAINIGTNIGVVVMEGKLVATTAGALGGGSLYVRQHTGTLAFHGVRDDAHPVTYPMAILGGGDIEVSGGSDITFDWRFGTLVNAPAAANNLIGNLTVTAASRLTALASGTLASVLGGRNVAVTVSDRSTLVLGREGITGRTLGTGAPIEYPIDAGSIALTGASTLVLQPNTWLNLTGALTFDDDSRLAFAAAGVSRLDYVYAAVPAVSEHLVPAGMTLERRVNAEAGRIDYIVTNQVANPVKNAGLAFAAADTVLDLAASRLHEDFLLPVAAAAAGAAADGKWAHGAFLRGITGDFNFDDAGWDGRLGGALAGFNSTLGRRLQLGFHAGITESNLSITTAATRAELRAKQRFLGLHAIQRLGRFHIGAHAARVLAHADTWRDETGIEVRGRFKNSGYTAGLEAGLTLAPWENTLIRPYAAVRYTELDLRDFDERIISKTGSPMAFAEQDITDTLSQLTFGVQAARRFTLLGRKASVSLNLAGRHALLAPDDTRDAVFADVPGMAPVTLARDDYYKDTAVIGASLRVLLPRRIQAGLDLEHETGSARTRDTAALSLGITW
ncbi:MAG: autotransporter domain-containing protein [Opitutaceae bacterium]|jgi:autotransporter-associated beta strand protein|nr:autotransporter domain-containing protein [Opitutaceae bacterium]